MAVAKTDLKFYLTASDPGVAQSDKAQSLGGYLSTTEIAASDVLTAPLKVDATSISAATSFTGRLLVGDELLTVAANVISARGELATVGKPHYTGIPIYRATSNSLFDNSFSEEMKQYRCIALRNSNQTDSFVTATVYFKFASRNSASAVRLAVETPTTAAHKATATGGSTLSLIDSALAHSLADNYYDDCALAFLSGSNINLVRKIISYDGATGTFVFDAVLPFAVAASTSYLVYPSPSQRIASGTEEPSVTWSAATSPVSCGTIGPNGVVYVWLERSEAANAEEYLGNRVVLTVSYKTA